MEGKVYIHRHKFERPRPASARPRARCSCCGARGMRLSQQPELRRLRLRQRRGAQMQLKIDFPQTFFFFHCCCKLIRQRRHGRKKSQRALCIICGTFSNAVAASLQHSTQIRSPARQEMKHGHNAQAECIQSPCLHPLRTDIISVSSKRRHN